MELSIFSEYLGFGIQRYFVGVLRAFSILGTLFLVFWVFKFKRAAKYRVPTIGKQKAKPMKEFLLGLVSFVPYTFGSLVVFFLAKEVGYSRMYTDVSSYGWIYTLISVPLFLLYNDSLFYWYHYGMHKSSLLYRAHKTHHSFINVTPLAAYAFHPAEAAISALSFVSLLLIFPWHPLAVLAFIVIAVFFNGMIHLGYDFYPSRWRQHYILKYLNTSSHHIYHHQRPETNFGFMFTFWDKVMKTESLPKWYRQRE